MAEIPDGYTTPSFRCVQERPLFLGMQPYHFSLAFLYSGVPFVITMLFAGFLYALAICGGTLAALLCIFKFLTAIDPYWYEHNFGNHKFPLTRWIES